MMAALRFIEILLLLGAALFAVRGARPASPPYGRRLTWIALLLLAQLAALYGFVLIETRFQWGIRAADPPGLAFLTQAIRAFLLLAAGRAWYGLIADKLTTPMRKLGLALVFLALMLGGSNLPVLAVIALLVIFNRMKWAETLSGWSRGITCVVAILLLLGLSLVPMTAVVDGRSTMQFALAPAPLSSSLLSGITSPGAAAELALIRPLDRFVQALVDLFRLQLVIVAIKLLFLPIRLSGMSLKRRFTINYMLVRGIPTFLSSIVFLALGYLVLGHLKLTAVRDQFERTLARAGTVAAAVAEDVERNPIARSDPDRIEGAVRSMGEDGRRAVVVVRDSTGVIAPLSAPPALINASIAGADSGDARGIVLAGDSLYFAAGHSIARGRVHVFVPIDSIYLARIMRPIGGDLRMTAQPDVFVGAKGVRIESARKWTGSKVQVRAMETNAGERRRWFLARTFLPVGTWARPIPGADSGAIELYLATTVRALIAGAIRGAPGVYANVFTILFVILAVTAISMIEGFAVRSGRSIIQSVLDEMTALRHAAERFGAGDLEYRLPVHGKDEFSVVANSFNQMAANLERQRDELLAKERFEQDLAVARDIQQRFLPQQAPSLEGLDLAGVSVPSREVGGDLFYWFTHADGSLGFTLGDVSGKSVPAALLMSNVLAALRAQDMDRLELAQSVGRVNRLIMGQMEPGRFVTLLYGEADARAGVLRYVSAGHNPPLLLRANGEIEWLREGGVPLGVMLDAEYKSATTRFERGDTLVVFSDGVTEALGPPLPGGIGASDPPSPDMFGDERLVRAVRVHAGRSAREILDAVLSAVAEFAKGTAQADDITIIVIRRV